LDTEGGGPGPGGERLSVTTTRNALYSLASWFLPMLVSLLAVPYLFKKLGDEGFGILALAMLFMGYLALLDLGLRDAIMKFIGEHMRRAEQDEVLAVAGTAAGAYVMAAGLGGCVLGAISGPLVRHVIHASEALSHAAIVSFRIAAAGFFIHMLLVGCGAFLQGAGRFGVTGRIAVANNIGATVATVGLLYLGYGLVEAVMAQFVIRALSLFAAILACRSVVPIAALRPRWDRQRLRRLIGFGRFTLVSRLVFQAVYQADRLVIGAMLGAAVMGVYQVPAQISAHVSAPAIQLGVVLLPLVSGMAAATEAQTVVQTYVRAARILALVALGVGAVTAGLARPFLEVWMGRDFARLGWAVLACLAVARAIHAAPVGLSYVTQAVGEPQLDAFYQVTAGCVVAALLYPFTKVWGIYGTALAVLAGPLVATPLFFLSVRKRLPELVRVKRMWQVFGAPGLCAGLTFGVAWYAGRYATDWPTLAAAALAAATVLVASAMLLGVLSGEDRKTLRGVLLIGLQSAGRRGR